MAKNDPPAEAVAEATPAPEQAPALTREEQLAATEADNARRAIEGHVVVHVEPRTTEAGE